MKGVKERIGDGKRGNGEIAAGKKRRQEMELSMGGERRESRGSPSCYYHSAQKG